MAVFFKEVLTARLVLLITGTVIIQCKSLQSAHACKINVFYALQVGGERE